VRPVSDISQRALRPRRALTLELGPAPGTTPPLMAMAVPLPPASPVTTATLP
jgi:hypothetical protein